MSCSRNVTRSINPKYAQAATAVAANKDIRLAKGMRIAVPSLRLTTELLQLTIPLVLVSEKFRKLYASCWPG